MPKPDAPGNALRVIGRTSSDIDGVTFAPPELVIEPDPQLGDSTRTRFDGITAFRYRDFYLGLVHTSHADARAIQPEWAWSHDGQSWARARTPCISLGDEGSFDCRIIRGGAVTMTDDELVWLYTGSDTRGASVGRAALAKADLDAWLDTLPQP